MSDMVKISDAIYKADKRAAALKANEVSAQYARQSTLAAVQTRVRDTGEASSESAADRLARVSKEYIGACDDEVKAIKEHRECLAEVEKLKRDYEIAKIKYSVE
jgi:hypothetical protein